mmetsp:Transcript_36785/g.102759  ORF Transcript_36785/g.102759 Transcript_36785/m.102759 type:complete len:206 (-) Transcript_36785:162-779(-)
MSAPSGSGTTWRPWSGEWRPSARRPTSSAAPLGRASAASSPLWAGRRTSSAPRSPSPSSPESARGRSPALPCMIISRRRSGRSSGSTAWSATWRRCARSSSTASAAARSGSACYARPSPRSTGTRWRRCWARPTAPPRAAAAPRRPGRPPAAGRPPRWRRMAGEQPPAAALQRGGGSGRPPDARSTSAWTTGRADLWQVPGDHAS